jgi:hypothetical protein
VSERERELYIFSSHMIRECCEKKSKCAREREREREEEKKIDVELVAQFE